MSDHSATTRGDASIALRATDDVGVRRVLYALAVVHLLTGLWQFLAPGNFYETVASFGARNDHFVRDVASISVALGAGFLLAARRPAWRVPILAVASVQYVVHAISHVIDAGKAEPTWLGPGTVVLLVLSLGLLVYLLRRSAAEAA